MCSLEVGKFSNSNKFNDKINSLKTYNELILINAYRELRGRNKLKFSQNGFKYVCKTKLYYVIMSR